MPFRLSRAAEADLLSIYQYSFDMFGPAQAEAYQDRIEQTINLVGENPQLARLRDEILPPVRIHPAGSHMIIYQIDANGFAHILRIRHQRENWLSDFD